MLIRYYFVVEYYQVLIWIGLVQIVRRIGKHAAACGFVPIFNTLELMHSRYGFIDKLAISRIVIYGQVCYTVICVTCFVLPSAIEMNETSTMSFHGSLVDTLIRQVLSTALNRLYGLHLVSAGSESVGGKMNTTG